MAGWEGLGKATSGDIARELFFFGEDHLLASLYAADPAARGPAFVLCPSWGLEMSHSLAFCQTLARRLAESGGAGLALHWPGHGDSGGEPERTDLDRMAAAVTAALDEARRRAPMFAWGLAGVRVGAAAATLAAAPGEAAALLLIRPAMDPGRFFAELERSSRRASLGRGHPRFWAFGHPLPQVRSPSNLETALSRFLRPVACIAYETDPLDPLIQGVECIRVPGSWEPGTRATNGTLADGALAWVETQQRAGRG